MVQNYVLSDSAARRWLEMCHPPHHRPRPLQEHTGKEQPGLLCRCSSSITTGFIIYAELVQVGETASLEDCRGTVQPERRP